jgi:hypothetical protein
MTNHGEGSNQAQAISAGRAAASASNAAKHLPDGTHAVVHGLTTGAVEHNGKGVVIVSFDEKTERHRADVIGMPGWEKQAPKIAAPKLKKIARVDPKTANCRRMLLERPAPRFYEESVPEAHNRSLMLDPTHQTILREIYEGRSPDRTVSCDKAQHKGSYGISDPRPGGPAPGALAHCRRELRLAACVRCTQAQCSTRRPDGHAQPTRPNTFACCAKGVGRFWVLFIRIHFACG